MTDHDRPPPRSSPNASSSASLGHRRRAGRLPRRPARLVPRPGAPAARPPPRSWSPGPAASARYAREWLEQQAATGVLTVDADGRFALPAGAGRGAHRRATASSYLAPLARMLGAAAGAAARPARRVPRRRRGQLGAVRRRHARVAGRHEPAVVPAPAGRRRCAALPEVHAVLGRPGARDRRRRLRGGLVERSRIARAYPEADVEGWDVDAPSIDLARANAAGRRGGGPGHLHADRRQPTARRGLRRGLRVRVHPRHGPAGGRAAPSMRRAVRAGRRRGDHGRGGGGAVRAAGRRRRAADVRLQPAHLPAGRPVLASRRRAPARSCGRTRCARTPRQAGFRDIEVLPTGEFGFWRFYRLLP